MSHPASFLCVALVLSAPVWPAPAQAVPWSLKVEQVVEKSPDGNVDLEVDLPVLAGHPEPKVQDRINQALRDASGLAARREELQELRKESWSR